MRTSEAIIFRCYFSTVINPCFNDMTQEEFDAGHKIGADVFQVVNRMLKKFSRDLKTSFYGFKDAMFGETLGYGGGIPTQATIDYGQFSHLFKREMVKVR